MDRTARLIRSPRFQTALCLALIAGLTYLFLWRLWAAAPADRAYLPEKSDLAEVFYPPRAFFARTLAAGEFALWNPHVYSGYPQFADPQAATFYPVALAFAWLAGPAYTLDTLGLDIGLHFFLAGAFSFLFFQRLFGARLPALAGALIFEFGGYLTFYPPLQLSELEVAAWFPLALLLVTLAVERRQRLLMAAAGISLGLIFLAGRPQSYLTAGPVALAWLAYTAHRAGRRPGEIARSALLLVAVALGTAAAQWLPTLQLTRLSTRSILTYAQVAEGGFPFDQLTGFFLPQLLGTQNLYVGFWAVLLAALAVARRRGLFWAGVFLACLFGSAGKHLILFDALYLVERLGFPGYLRNVERLAFGMTFSLAALSGYGIQLVRTEGGRLLRPVVAGAGALLGLATLLTWLWTITRPPDAVYDPNLPVGALAFAALMLLGGGLAFWLFRDRPWVAASALVIIAVLDVMSVNHGRFWVAQPPPPGNDMARVAAAPPGRSTVYRTVFDQTSSQDFGSLLGVDNVGGLPPLMLIDYQRLLAILDEYRRNLLLNVEMVVTTGEYTDPAFELVRRDEPFAYYRFVVAKPRAYLVRDVVPVSDAAAAAERLAAPDFDYGHVALVVGDPGLGAGPELGPAESATIVDRSANAITIQVVAEAPRLLVLADTYYPGWQAEVDGQPAPLYPTNVALRGVVVPPGAHTVVMRFRPGAFFAGVALSLATVLGVLLFAGRLLWRDLPKSR